MVLAAAWITYSQVWNERSPGSGPINLPNVSRLEPTMCPDRYLFNRNKLKILLDDSNLHWKAVDEEISIGNCDCVSNYEALLPTWKNKVSCDYCASKEGINTQYRVCILSRIETAIVQKFNFVVRRMLVWFGWLFSEEKKLQRVRSLQGKLSSILWNSVVYVFVVLAHFQSFIHSNFESLY